MIVYDFPTIPIPDGIATILLIVDDIALQNDGSSRGIGIFYDLYGADASAGALMAWVWAVTAILDSLERTPEALINTAKVGVTGCSRDGKGALVAGAFEERLVLTIPQESGSGGSACWRLSDAEVGAPDLVQTAHEIVQENVWFSELFDPYVNNTAIIPFDHHMLDGLVAPRGLFTLDNPAYQWLGPWSSWGCNKAGHAVYEALGVPDNFGFSMSSNHTHCEFPDEQLDNLNVFFQKFLLDEPANTNVETDYGNVTFPLREWVLWSTPDLTR
jgi:hypothetical protein